MTSLKNTVRPFFEGRVTIPKPTISVRDRSILSRKVAILTIALSLFGLLMIYSASSYCAERSFGDPFYYVKKQAIAFLVGVVAMTALSRMNTLFLKKIRYVILTVSFALLAVIFIPGVGVESYGAKRWIDLGFMTIQPSEIAKFGYVIYAASYISDHGVSRLRDLLCLGFVGVSMCALIMLEPNMSITMCLVCVILFMFLAGGIKLRKILLLAIPLVIAVPVLIFLEPYRLKRLMAFLDPWASPKAEGYQLIQSYYALCRGGLFGVGLFQSRQKYLFLPFAESDFIFSVIGEELGLFGAMCVVIAFIFLIRYGFLIAARAKDRYKALLAAGITSVIAVQTALNLAVVTGCVPPTGLPLPFISAGGSSLVSFMSAVGVLLSVERSGGNFYTENHKM